MILEKATCESREPMISVVINTLNEEQNIGDCIESVRDFADEIVVCDMYSDDRTVEIAQAMGARVVYHERTGFVEPARHYAISQAKYEWVFVLDADERMTEPLALKLHEIAREDACDVVSLSVLYWYFGGWVRHGGFSENTWHRLFRKSVYLDVYTQNEETVHKNFSALKELENKIVLPSQFHILHLAYPTIEKYACKTLGRYAVIEAEHYYQQGRKFSFFRMIGEPLLDIGKRLIWKGGYRDGLRGFILIVLRAGYRFAIWANVWLLEELARQNDRASSTTE